MPALKRPVPTTGSPLLAEIWEWSRNTEQLPYADLPRAFLDAGYVWRLRETGVTPMPDATVLVHFDLLVGRDPASLDLFDSFAMRMPAGPGPVSFAARSASAQTIIYLVTGRMPPMANTPPASDARPAYNGREVDVALDDADVVFDPPPEDEPEEPGLDLVERREPDGLPILRDLDAIDPREASSSAIVDAMLDLVDGFMTTATLEQIDAFGAKNEAALSFVRSVGTDEQRNELFAMVKNRRKALSPTTSTAPRRRTATH